jgi:YidC/Oxa1 family membrane protein insertase
MDKKNTTIGILLLLAAIGLFMWQSKQAQAYEKTQAARAQQEIAEQARTAIAERQSQPAISTGQPAVAAPAAQPQVDIKPDQPEQRPVLENDFFRVEFTTWGGAVRTVNFKTYPAVQGENKPYSFNEEATFPALAVDKWDGKEITPTVDAFAIVEKSATKIAFTRQIAPGVWLDRTYEISLEKEGAATYTISHVSTIRNESATAFTPQPFFIDLGVATPDKADSYGYSLNSGYYNGESFIFDRISDFAGGGFLGFTHHDPKTFVQWNDSVVWATTKNQFFASILTPSKPAQHVIARPIHLAPNIDGVVTQGLATAIGFDIPTIAAGGRADITMTCYVGPKEYKRLAKLTDHQDKVMQFGWSKPLGFIGNFVAFVGKLFYTCLGGIQLLVINWGLAIIVMTIIIRLIFWPLTAKAADSSRKMAKLQKPLKEIQEKYKDNPKKRNEETLALWKKHKINPLAGCLPVLIQLPIFIAFYYMLRGASELRFAHFLWISDLSLPDTVATLWSFPVNIMPLLMGVSMFYQMHLAPSPSTDPTQAKIMKFMPLIFLFFCYNFSSGLVLYWTISNCMSIIQQLHTNHKRNLEDAEELAGPNGKVVDAKLVAKSTKAKGGKNKK